MLWDIFCDIIDNHGDLGVTWRLSEALANRGESVRLWIQGDASALDWMAPQGHPRVRVLGWEECPTSPTGPPGDVLLEAFGCEPPMAWVQHCAEQGRENEQAFPVWINLEYLSAEAYVERCHGLASPVMSGPGKGQTKWFFYPGFTDKTGGLIHRLSPQAVTTPTRPSTSTTISSESPHENLGTDFSADSRPIQGQLQSAQCFRRRGAQISTSASSAMNPLHCRFGWRFYKPVAWAKKQRCTLPRAALRRRYTERWPAPIASLLSALISSPTNRKSRLTNV